MKRKLTPEEREELRQLDQFGREARENMQRILDEVRARQREREERRRRGGLWQRLLRRAA